MTWLGFVTVLLVICGLAAVSAAAEHNIIITLLACLYLPLLIAACWASYRRGYADGLYRGHDQAAEILIAREAWAEPGLIERYRIAGIL